MFHSGVGALLSGKVESLQDPRIEGDARGHGHSAKKSKVRKLRGGNIFPTPTRRRCLPCCKKKKCTKGGSSGGTQEKEAQKRHTNDGGKGSPPS